jgi:hypothetical protein
VFSTGNSGQGMAAALPVLLTLGVGAAVLGPIAIAMVLWHGLLGRLVTSLIAFTVGVGAFAIGFRIAAAWATPRQPELLAALQRRAGG